MTEECKTGLLHGPDHDPTFCRVIGRAQTVGDWELQVQDAKAQK